MCVFLLFSAMYFFLPFLPKRIPQCRIITVEGSARISRKGRDSVEKFQVMIGLVGVIALVAVGFVLNFAQAVFIPLIIAWLLSYLFGPIVRYLAKRRVPVGLAVVFVLAIFFGLCFLGAIFLNTRIASFAAAFPKYYSRLMEIGKSLTTNLDIPPDFWTSINWGFTIRGYLLDLSSSFVTIISKLVMVIVFLVFMLLGSPYFEYKVKKPLSRPRLRTCTQDSEHRGRWGATSALGAHQHGDRADRLMSLEYLRVDFAVTWEARFHPQLHPDDRLDRHVHPSDHGRSPVLPEPDSPPSPRFTLTIQVVIGNFITPKVMGDRLNLSQ